MAHNLCTVNLKSFEIKASDTEVQAIVNEL